jgi:MFS family permease
MLTPYTVTIAVMGVIAGFLLARTNRYKWLYVVSYVLVALALFVMWRFSSETPIWFYVLAISLAGVGLGAIGTLNTLIAQLAVPKKLLGVAVGAMFFFQMIGIIVAPAILGLAQRSDPSLEIGLKRVFLVGAVAMVGALLLILTIPEVSTNAEFPDRDVNKSKDVDTS